MPEVFVGIGSNIDRENSIRAGIADLQRQFGRMRLSSVYESEAVGFEGDPFYNLVAAFDTELDIEQIRVVLEEIEERHGRIRSGVRFSSRTLDIDLLLYDDLISKGEGYHVPRDEILRYAFVLQPLAEIAPHYRHPETGASYAEMWSSFDKESQPLKVVLLHW